MKKTLFILALLPMAIQAEMIQINFSDSTAKADDKGTKITTSRCIPPTHQAMSVGSPKTSSSIDAIVAAISDINESLLEKALIGVYPGSMDTHIVDNQGKPCVSVSLHMLYKQGTKIADLKVPMMTRNQDCGFVATHLTGFKGVAYKPRVAKDPMAREEKVVGYEATLSVTCKKLSGDMFNTLYVSLDVVKK